jgi:hypothetical protein
MLQHIPARKFKKFTIVIFGKPVLNFKTKL